MLFYFLLGLLPQTLLTNSIAFQEIWQLRTGPGTVEEVWPRQRLEYRFSAKTSYGEWRVDEHSRIYRRDKIPGVQANSRKLRPDRRRDEGECCQGSLGCWGSAEVAVDGLV